MRSGVSNDNLTAPIRSRLTVVLGDGNQLTYRVSHSNGPKLSTCPFALDFDKASRRASVSQDRYLAAIEIKGYEYLDLLQIRLGR
jgi:hypothetical protein